MRPIDGDWEGTGFEMRLEVYLWISTIGFILYEVAEALDKGMGEYLNLGVKGQTNCMHHIPYSNLDDSIDVSLLISDGYGFVLKLDHHRLCSVDLRIWKRR